MILLASNENPLGMPLAAQQAAAAALQGAGAYPDANGGELKAALAARLEVPTGWITLGSGSSEILTLAAQACVQPGYGVVWSQYWLHRLRAGGGSGPGARPWWCPRTTAPRPGRHARGRECGHAPDLCGQPHNPTGSFIDPAWLQGFIASVPPHVTVLLDEAYTEYLSPNSATTAWTGCAPIPT